MPKNIMDGTCWYYYWSPNRLYYYVQIVLDKFGRTNLIFYIKLWHGLKANTEVVLLYSLPAFDMSYTEQFC